MQEIRDAINQLGVLINAHGPRLSHVEQAVQQLTTTVQQLCARPPPAPSATAVAPAVGPVPALWLLHLFLPPLSRLLLQPHNHSRENPTPVEALCYNALRYSSTKHTSSPPRWQRWATSSPVSRDQPWIGQPPFQSASCRRSGIARRS